jgi:endonuclease YncB( thermonuclease family)
LKIFKSFFLSGFLLFFVISCQDLQDYSKVTVTEVIDGDTIKLSNGRSLRYIGIDTPETSERKGQKFVSNPQPFSLEAADYNRDLVLGKEVKVEFDIQKTDRYSRLLGYCFINGLFVNKKLLEEGLAVLYTYPPNVKYVDDLYLAQKRARSLKKGLWADQEIISADEAHNYLGEIRRVRGKVISAYSTSKCVYLNFGENYKSDFTIVIFANSLSAFKDRGIAPASFYRGKIVEAIGRIRSYNGPEIIVNNPYEIEVL